jgi:hypothetical protein
MLAMALPVGSMYDSEVDKTAVYSSPARVKKGPIDMPDGSVYEGEWTVDGRVEGLGVQTWPDGATYDGEFLSGEKHGFGVKTTSNGQSYCGFW